MSQSKPQYRRRRHTGNCYCRIEIRKAVGRRAYTVAPAVHFDRHQEVVGVCRCHASVVGFVPLPLLLLVPSSVTGVDMPENSAALPADMSLPAKVTVPDDEPPLEMP